MGRNCSFSFFLSREFVMNCEENLVLVGSCIEPLTVLPEPHGLEAMGLESVGLADWWIEIAGDDRWTVYQRLQSLGCRCTCAIGEPLRLQVRSPQDLVQAWMVLRHQSLGCADRRQALLATLETCWQLA
jgi:hypothetical protein